MDCHLSVLQLFPEEEWVKILSQVVDRELEGVFSLFFLQPVVALRNVVVWFTAYLHRQFC